MKQVLLLKDKLGVEIRTRIIIERLSKELNSNTEYLFDMSGVEFISRSAADELFNLIDERGHIILVNMCSFVQKMFDAVALSRFANRNLSITDVPVTYCEDIDSLSRCLKSIS